MNHKHIGVGIAENIDDTDTDEWFYAYVCDNLFAVR